MSLFTRPLLNTRLTLKRFINNQLANYFLFFLLSWLLVWLFGASPASATARPLDQLPSQYSAAIETFKGYLIVFLVAASGVGLMIGFIKSLRGG